MTDQKPTKYQRTMLARARKVPIICTRRPEHEDEYTFADGRKCGRRSVETAIKEGWLRVSDEGLLPGEPQAFMAADA